MADDVVRIDITGKINPGIATSLRNIAKAALEADTNLDLLRNSISQFSAAQQLKAAAADTRTLRNEITRATQSQQQFTKANAATAQSLNNVATSATKYGNALKNVNGANVSLIGGLNNTRSAITGLVGLFGGIFAFQKYAQAQDALTGLQNKLRALTADTQRQMDLERQLFDIANRTRTGIESVTDGFVRYRKAMRDASDPEVLRFTETLNKLLVSAGRTTAEVNSVVIQLGQALTSGRLQGDEFRSLSENLPREALEAFARQLDVGVDQLKAMSTQGKITTDVIRAAFAELAGLADSQFARTIPTISQSIEVLNNKFIAFTQSSSSGAAILSSAILTIANNLNIVIPLVVAFAGVWAAIKIAAIVLEFAALAKAVISLGVAFTAANLTLIVWVGAIGLAVTAVIALAYAVATAVGKGEEFETMIANAIDKAKNWAGEMLGMGDKTGLASEAQETLNKALEDSNEMLKKAQQSIGDTSIEIEGMTNAANDNKEAVKSWADSTVKEVERVANAYFELTQAQQQAMLAGAEQHYNQLQAMGGSSGSFTALGKPNVGSSGNSSSISSLPPPKPKGYRNGGSFRVSGRPGVDTNLVSFRASRGEQVDITTPAQQRKNRETVVNQGDQYITFNIATPDVESFRLSRAQIAAQIAASVG